MVVESANEAEKPEQSPIAIRKDRHPGWGGRRPGAGAPKGNLNALKHGRNSRRQAQLVEALMQVPQTRDTLIALGKRNRRLRKQAEEGTGVLMTRLLENVARITLNQACPEHGRRGDKSRPKQSRISRLPQHRHRPNENTSRKAIKA